MIGFVYGYISHRSKLFPSNWLSALYDRMYKPAQQPPAVPEERAGRWRSNSANDSLSKFTSRQLEEMEKLRSIGYVSGSRPVPKHRLGITLYDKASAYNGLNLYTSGHGPEAILMDMEGKELHKWRYDFEAAWPNDPMAGTNSHTQYWRRALLFPNGDLCAIFEGIGIIKLNKESKLLWSYRGGAHHDMFAAVDGSIYVLTREPRIIPRINREQPVLEDFVTVLNSDGEFKKKISILEAFENSDYAPILKRMEKQGDILHTNTIRVLDGSQAKRSPAFKENNILISILKLDAVAVLDIDTARIVWSINGMWREQHQPILLEDGNMLLFDNLGNGGRSKVIEFDPLTQRVVWTYGLGTGESLFSETCGSVQRLPNGNTLITESDAGRALEVTRSNLIVWEYFNPAQVNDRNRELIATLFEVTRIPLQFPLDWL